MYCLHSLHSSIMTRKQCDSLIQYVLVLQSEQKYVSLLYPEKTLVILLLYWQFKETDLGETCLETSWCKDRTINIAINSSLPQCQNRMHTIESMMAPQQIRKTIKAQDRMKDLTSIRRGETTMLGLIEGCMSRLTFTTTATLERGTQVRTLGNHSLTH